MLLTVARMMVQSSHHGFLTIMNRLYNLNPSVRITNAKVRSIVTMARVLIESFGGQSLGLMREKSGPSMIPVDESPEMEKNRIGGRWETEIKSSATLTSGSLAFFEHFMLLF
jgi:hypothetical protein